VEYGKGTFIPTQAARNSLDVEPGLSRLTVMAMIFNPGNHG